MANDYELWDRGNIRGIARKAFLGTEQDADGNTVNVYEADNAEWGGTSTANLEYEFKYVQWHQTYHKGVRDPRCTICQSEAQFREQRAPHEQNHRARGQFDPNCRFCQDDRFLGRM